MENGERRIVNGTLCVVARGRLSSRAVGRATRSVLFSAGRQGDILTEERAPTVGPSASSTHPACLFEGRDPVPDRRLEYALSKKGGQASPYRQTSAPAHKGKHSDSPQVSPLERGGQGPTEGGHPGERGRKEMAPKVGASAHLPTLSLPLQGGDVGLTVLAREEGTRHPQRSGSFQQKSGHSLLRK
jgi:hypothetical protein